MKKNKTVKILLVVPDGMNENYWRIDFVGTLFKRNIKKREKIHYLLVYSLMSNLE